MMKEIEKKYLITKLNFNPQNFPGLTIKQGYLMVSERGDEARLRDKGGRFFLTLKKGTGVEREEREIEITDEQFHSLWPMTAGARVEKRRHLIPSGQHTFELDIYSGVLQGLITVEVQFTSIEASEQFSPPDWFGEDITLDSRYKNQNLAQKGIPDISD